MKRKLFKRGIKRQSPNSKEGIGILIAELLQPDSRTAGQPESLLPGVLKDPHQPRARLPSISTRGLL